MPLKVQDVKPPLTCGRYLLTASFNPPNKPDFASLSRDDKAKALKDMEEEQAYEVLEEIPYWSNGRGFTSRVRSRLYLYNAEEDALEALTSETLQAGPVQLNASKTKAVFTGMDYTGKAPLENALYVANLKQKSVRRVTPNEDFLIPILISSMMNSCSAEALSGAPSALMKIPPFLSCQPGRRQQTASHS